MRTGNLLDLEQIYALEKMVFKNEAWTIDMLKIELSVEGLLTKFK